MTENSATPLETVQYLRSLPYAEYLKTHHWKTISRAARNHYGDACIFCGSLTDTQVHHRTYKRLGQERLRDLSVLCAKHHSGFHGHTDDNIGSIRSGIANMLRDGRPRTIPEPSKEWTQALRELEAEGVIARVQSPKRTPYAKSHEWLLIHAHFVRIINEEAA